MATIVTTMLALARTNEVKNALSGLLMERGDISLETEVGSLKSVGPDFAERLNRANMLLVDLDIEDPSELMPLRQIISERRGRLSVIATSQALTAQGVRELVRQGIDDFIPQPLDQQSLLDAIDVAKRKVRQNRGGGPSGGQVITVGRAKGGMGATTLAVNLALSLIEPIGKEEPKSASACSISTYSSATSPSISTWTPDPTSSTSCRNRPGSTPRCCSAP